MDDDIQLLCTAVQKHNSLKTLSLDGNNIMSAGFKHICDMLKITPSITNMGYLRSLPEVFTIELADSQIERMYNEEDRENVKVSRRNAFTIMMKHSQ